MAAIHIRLLPLGSNLGGSLPPFETFPKHVRTLVGDMIVRLSQTQKSVEPSIFKALHLSPPLFGRTLLVEHYPAPLAATVSVALGLQEGLSDISATPPPLKHR